jgi:prepilin-type N-terminal cleavage/methylation domain-containing protein
MVASYRQGFTLIELSIVLVIIGLIVGSVLAGQNLISAAAVRAQISQIERYNTAANTFRGKYGYLPGDIPSVNAVSFGFGARGIYPGEGDGNAVIEGSYGYAQTGNYGPYQGGGETLMFWQDLGAAHLIDFVGISNTSSILCCMGNIPSASLSQYFPTAKIGQGNYVYAWSWQGVNYYGVSAASYVGGANGTLFSSPTIPVVQAYNVDKKMDDGLPQSGRVQAFYVTDDGSTTMVWSGGVDNSLVPFTTATAASSTSCFDNSNTASGIQKYSLSQSNGAGANCALSFQFQ